MGSGSYLSVYFIYTLFTNNLSLTSTYLFTYFFTEVSLDGATTPIPL